MKSTKSFQNLTAADLMSRDLVLVPQEMSIHGAARLLARAAVSGAPIVDAEGVCVGVLSSNDFVRWAENGEAARRPQPESSCLHSSWEMVKTEEFVGDRVSACMTRDPVTVGPLAGINELARKMVDAHIHRLVVVDERERPIGVVSATDVLAAVAYADLRQGCSSRA